MPKFVSQDETAVLVKHQFDIGSEGTGAGKNYKLQMGKPIPIFSLGFPLLGLVLYFPFQFCILWLIKGILHTYAELMLRSSNC
jgi:hypothetical protein